MTRSFSKSLTSIKSLTSHCRNRRARRPHAEMLEGRLLLTAGDLDLTFGNGNGYVLTKSASDKKNSSSDTAEAVAIQGDGKILAAGSSGTTTGKMEVVRLNTDGSLDDGSPKDITQGDTFGSGGRFLSADQGLAQDVAVDSMGRIVLVGTLTQTSSRIGLIRLLPNGTPDPAFGQNGEVVTLVNGNDNGEAVAIQSNGKIVVGAYTYTGASNSGYGLLLRYNTDGSLDDGSVNDSTPGDSFGQGGMVKASWAPSLNDGIFDLAIQSDDKIVVSGSISPQAGSNSYGRYLARYDTAGNVDVGFGTQGQVKLPVSPTKPALTKQPIVIQPDGAIVWAGSDFNGTDEDVAVARVTTAGVLDTTFGAVSGAARTGYIVIPHDGDQVAWGVTIQPDGKLVVAGRSDTKPAKPGGSSAYVTDSLIARLRPDGTLDTSFQSGGFEFHSFASTSAEGLYDVAVQAGGNIVAAGFAVPDGASGFAFLIARFKGDSASSPAGPSLSAQGSRTTTTFIDAPLVAPLDPSIDLDLTQLAIEWLRSTPKRSRPALRAPSRLGDG
jgi:uncharacterized delta-60 repeat protein